MAVSRMTSNGACGSAFYSMERPHLPKLRSTICTTGIMLGIFSIIVFAHHLKLSGSDASKHHSIIICVTFIRHPRKFPVMLIIDQ